MAWDSAKKHADIALSNSDRTATRASASGHRKVLGLLAWDTGAAAKYAEFEVDYNGLTTTAVYVGCAAVAAISYSAPNGDQSDEWGWGNFASGRTLNGGTAINTGYGAPPGTTDRVAFATDAAGNIWWGSITAGEVTWKGGGDPALGTSPAYTNLSGAAMFVGASMAGNGQAVTVYEDEGDWQVASPWAVSADGGGIGQLGLSAINVSVVGLSPSGIATV